MAVGELVKRIFNTEEKNAAAVVQASFIAALEAKDQEDRLNAQRLIDWYNRDRTAIIEHIATAARKSFEKTTDWQFPVINGVPRTISRRSMAYRQPPVRDYTVAGEEVKDETPVHDAILGMLEGVDVNRKMRALDRWSTLLNTVHAEVVHRKGLIDWDIRLRPNVTIVPDPEDFLEFAKFAYKWAPMDPETLIPVEGWVYWTDEMHAFVGKGGAWAGMSNKEGTNPFRDAKGDPVIPIVTVRKLEDISDYWGAFGADLVDATQAMNLQLGNMWETMQMQTHGQPFFVNVDLPGGATPVVGAKHAIVVKKVMKDEVPPSLTFPKPEPDLAEVQGVLDWFLKMNAGAYGLPPSAWSMDEQRLSGFAKFMDNIELMESREEEIENWEKVENELLAKSAIVWNTLNLGTAVPLDIGVRLTFPEVKIPETPTERTTRWTLAISGGMASLVDYFQEEEGLDAKQAEEKALAVAEMNKKIGKIGVPEPALAPPPIPAKEGDEE